MKRFLLATLLSAIGFSAHAAVMDFNELSGSGLVDRGDTYHEEGFQLNTAAGGWGFTSIHATDYRYDGSIGFFNRSDSGITTLTKVDGGAFSLDKIDLDSLNGGYQVTVDFIGTLANGGTVTNSFRTNAANNLQTFTFDASFDNVNAVSWTQASPYHSFDNIVLANAGAPAAEVPEPGTVAMFGLGLLAFMASRRKKAAN